jgi:membrane fusion protein, multidrug efflux system
LRLIFAGLIVDTTESDLGLETDSNTAMRSHYVDGPLNARKTSVRVRKSANLGVKRLRRDLRRFRQREEALRRTPQPDRREFPEVNLDSPSDRGHPRWLLSHPVRIVFLIVFAALLVIAGLRFWNYLQSYEWTDDAEIDGHLDPISTRINETVIHVYVENTYHVKKGQPLVDLDPRDYQVAVENAAANLAEAQQGVRAAQQNYNLTLANLAGAVASNKKAQDDAVNYGVLLAHKVISSEFYEQIASVAGVDAAAVRSDQAAIKAAKRMIGQADAAMKAAQAQLDQAKLNLSYTHILAPADGVVGDKTVEVGQRVQPGEQLLTIVPLNHIWVTADFRETQLRRMHRGQKVTIHVDTTGRDYQGYVEGLPGATGELFSLLPPENATGNYVKVVQRLPVRIRFYPGQDPHHRLRPGMSVEPTVWLNGR